MRKQVKNPSSGTYSSKFSQGTWEGNGQIVGKNLETTIAKLSAIEARQCHTQFCCGTAMFSGELWLRCDEGGDMRENATRDRGHRITPAGLIFSSGDTLPWYFGFLPSWWLYNFIDKMYISMASSLLSSHWRGTHDEFQLSHLHAHFPNQTQILSHYAI